MTVTMDREYEDLYASIDCLLRDICTFFETKSLHMSPADKKRADSLIERSKKHLQIIKKFSSSDENKSYDVPINQPLASAEINDSKANERYVDMTKKPVLPQKTLIIEQPLYESTCPFKDLPAKETSHEIKYGPLSRRKRVLNIIDVSTKIYAVIHENWLLIYNSSKDLKPYCALDLKLYEAREDETDPTLTQVEINRDEVPKKNNLNFKMSSSFKIFHSSAEKKTYSFVATTHKDMLQWVVNINRRHDKAGLPAREREAQDEQNYEICQDLHGSDKEENIYNEIEMPCRYAECRPNSPKISEIDDRPAIPEKRPIAPKNVPCLTSVSKSTESMICYEELEQNVSVQNETLKNSLSSFETSDDEEDQTYYELDTVTKNKVDVKQIEEESKFIFDVPPPPVLFSETVETMDNNQESTYENDLALQRTQLLKMQRDSGNSVTKCTNAKNNESPKTNSQFLNTSVPTQNRSAVKQSVNKSPNFEAKVLKPAAPSYHETTGKPDLSEKNVPKPLATKPKILSPKPWKPFKKHFAKSPQPSNEGVKSTIRAEDKSYLEESSCKDSSKTNDNAETSSNDPSETPSDVCSLKPRQGSSIVRIIRNRWSTTQSSAASCSLETFSRNTKIETFQASPTKETPPTDFLRSSNKDLNDSLRPIESLVPDFSKNGNKEDEKPMVLLKSSLEDEESESSKKLKKSPIVPVKPKKIAKKLAL